jgi:hypothetical protein
MWAGISLGDLVRWLQQLAPLPPLLQLTPCLGPCLGLPQWLTLPMF